MKVAPEGGSLMCYDRTLHYVKIGHFIFIAFSSSYIVFFLVDGDPEPDLEPSASVVGRLEHRH